jgi:hypothetical protein
MSPPEVWGPPIWMLFHMLAEKINDDYYNILYRQLFNNIVNVCKYLPCPECSNHASHFLAKVKVNELKDKTAFKNMLYIFHNHVNVRKRKSLYNYADMDKYKYVKIIPVLNRFIAVYNTKGNMQQLNQSFQRQFIIKHFKTWIMTNIRAFVVSKPAIMPPNPISGNTDNSNTDNSNTDNSNIENR